MIWTGLYSHIWFVRCKWDNTYRHVLTFDTWREQFETITSIPNSFDFHDESNTLYSYLRKNNTIIVPYPIERLREQNYMVVEQPLGYNVDAMPSGEPATNRYYYFINDMEYVNDNATRLIVELDVFQTYMFCHNVNPCYIEREHVIDDIAGNHTIPENLEVGEYITKSEQFIDLNKQAIVIVTAPVVGTTFNKTQNITNGYAMYIFKEYGPEGAEPTSAQAWLQAELSTWSDDELASIYDVFMIPDILVDESQVSELLHYTYFMIRNSGNVSEHNFNVKIGVENLDGYTPKNKKLYTFPYTYLEASNLKGNTQIYKRELFETFSTGENDNPNQTTPFNLQGNCNSMGDAILYPRDYAGNDRAWNKALNYGGYVHTGWGIDGYTLYTAQNSNTTTATLLASVGAIVGGVVAKSPTAIGGGVMGVMHTMAGQEDAQHKIDMNKGSISNNTLQLSMGQSGFLFKLVTIKKEYAKMIDDFFTMYGYKVNTVKKPNIKTRKNFNYIKTQGCIVDGGQEDTRYEGSGFGINHTDMQKIANAYDNGVTFWHNYETMYDYNSDNSVI